MIKSNPTTKPSTSKPLFRTVELFAGVGGFRLGLEGKKGSKSPYKIVWSNQWEPSTTVQHASNIYVKHWGPEGHSNEDISKVNIKNIPDHEVLVGGFPCQDYSVARNLGHARGLVGKKGVLWWEIHRILKEKRHKAPSYLILENVDRLLKSPAQRRGRDFAIMLASLADLDYIVEWRVINAADYGMPQRRRRVFIIGYKKSSTLYNQVSDQKDPFDWVLKNGLMAKAFPVEAPPQFKIPNLTITGDLPYVTDRFNMANPNLSPFHNTGVMIDREVYTLSTRSNYNGGKSVLGDVLLPEKSIPREYFISDSEIKKWEYLKGAKNEERSTKIGFKYTYTEGAIAFPDPLDRPSRTIITGEGGNTPSRFKHVVRTKSGKLRRLMPIELERLNQFPDDHTLGVSDARRAFFMGNALVVGIIKRIGEALASHCFSSKRKPQLT